MSRFRTRCLVGFCILGGTALAQCAGWGEAKHRVVEGESVWSIARAVGVDYQSILAANGLTEDSVIRPGQELVIPSRDQSRASAPAASASVTHIVRAGESLWTIARRYGTTVRAIAAANDIDPDKALRVGTRLDIPAGGAAPEEAAGHSEAEAIELYEVRAGDSLWTIARRYGISLSALARANDLEVDAILRVGQVLMVPGSRAVAANVDAAEVENRFVRTAMQYKGVRYRYGGMTSRGMDCSGLVARVLRVHGIDAPHNSKALYALGQPVSRDQLHAGDLVFFHTTRAGISHVGIYIGNGRFIHASSSGGCVQIDRLDTGYYREHYVGARRVY